MTAKPCCPGEA